MKYLITGATGLIGSHFIRSLSADDEVVALTRCHEEKAKTLIGHCKCMLNVINSLTSLVSLNEFDCVINLAGEPIANKRWGYTQKHNIQHSRWQTSSQLVALFEASQDAPHTFISGSAIGFYGRQGNNLVTEGNTQAHKEFTHDLCATWENIALAAQSETTRVCVIRTGVVLANNHGALAKMTLPFNLGLGGKIGSGEQGMSWIHITDVVEALHFIVQTDSLVGPINLTAPTPVANLEFVKALGKALHRPTLIPMPEFVLRAIMGESADLLLTGQFVIPKKLSEADFQFQYPKLEPALDNLLS